MSSSLPIEKTTPDHGISAPKKLLLIFTRNPELGKCKTRLATTVGKQNALDIYKLLLKHTAELTKDVNVGKQVWYSEEIWQDDIWDATIYDKRLQQGNDLGDRMAHAFHAGFTEGFERIIIIGSDMYDLQSSDIEKAFKGLDDSDYVLGGADDGGYYLLGMKTFDARIFQNKKWGTDTVLKDTLNDLKNHSLFSLENRNDIDIYADVKDIKAFQPYLKNI